MTGWTGIAAAPKKRRSAAQKEATAKALEKAAEARRTRALQAQQAAPLHAHSSDGNESLERIGALGTGSSAVAQGARRQRTFALTRKKRRSAAQKAATARATLSRKKASEAHEGGVSDGIRAQIMDTSESLGKTQ